MSSATIITRVPRFRLAGRSMPGSSATAFGLFLSSAFRAWQRVLTSKAGYCPKVDVRKRRLSILPGTTSQDHPVHRGF